jgi:hypothetical protein
MACEITTLHWSTGFCTIHTTGSFLPSTDKVTGLHRKKGYYQNKIRGVFRMPHQKSVGKEK